MEKGITLKPTRNWRNEAAYGLKQPKPDILRHLGRKEEALALAWGGFEENPNELAYEHPIRDVPEEEGQRATNGPWPPQTRPTSADSSPCA